jgi:MAE_28990/MAE_18760-like HEPN
MDGFCQVFDERLREIESYLELLDGLEQQVQQGIPRFGNNGVKITTEQQKILYSSVYLQLYSLVEATITGCVNSFCQAITYKSSHLHELSIDVRREWVRFVAKTHADLTYDNRLDNALTMCNLLLQPISSIEIDRGGGGNWDDKEIHKLIQRLGLSIEITRQTEIDIKRPFKDDRGALSLIKYFRNKLAHGNISFVECAEDITVSDLRKLTGITSSYLREVVIGFQKSIDAHEFLDPGKKTA